MAEYTVVIGNKNYSSWSMRPWVALKAAGIATAASPADLGVTMQQAMKAKQRA